MQALAASCEPVFAMTGKEALLNSLFYHVVPCLPHLLLTLSHPEALPWRVNSGVRQSKIIKGPVLACLGGKGLIFPRKHTLLQGFLEISPNACVYISRALKNKGNTPKYGLIFHSSFIGRAAAQNKGRISRYLANKCSIASRIDCFSGKF